MSQKPPPLGFLHIFTRTAGPYSKALALTPGYTGLDKRPSLLIFIGCSRPVIWFFPSLKKTWALMFGSKPTPKRRIFATYPSI